LCFVILAWPREALFTIEPVHILARYHELTQLLRTEVSPSTFQHTRTSFARFVGFLNEQGVSKSEQIALRHIIDYMATWDYADSTRIVEVRLLKFFLRRLHRGDLHSEIKTPKQTAEGRARRRPSPYSDQEIKAFRKVADPGTELFFLTSIQTGLALADLVLLKPDNLVDGCIQTRRQKTGKLVLIPVEPSLYERLRRSLPFWRPRDPHSKRWRSGIQLWGSKVRLYSEIAGIYKKGNTTHRGRDSFVERQLAAGVPVAVIASRLGDRLDTMMIHYADLLSPKMRDVNLAAPVVRL